LGDYLQFNRIIGGIQLVQTIAAPAKCKTGKYDSFSELWGKGCFPVPTYFNIPPEDHHAEIIGAYDRQEWLLLKDPVDPVLIQKTVDMETGCQGMTGAACLCKTCQEAGEPFAPWIDEKTQKVTARFLVFNPTYGQFASVSSVFFFTRSGHIWKMLVVQNFQMAPYGVNDVGGSAALIGAAIVWCAILVKMAAEEVVEIYATFRDYGVRETPARYLGVWNVMDWVSIAGSFPVLIVWLQYDLAVGDVNAAMERLIAEELLQDLGELDALYRLVDIATASAKDQRYLLFAYPVVVMLRLFKSFNKQPRLALVTQTLGDCALDILHFGFVLAVIFFTYVVSGICLFGQNLPEFARFDRAVHVTFMMLLGGSDWDAMADAAGGQVQAGVFYWTFNILMCTLMLNMLLAIIMETYGGVKGRIGVDAETLVSQAMEIYSRSRKAKSGEYIRLDQVLDALHRKEEKTLMDRSSAEFRNGNGTAKHIQLRDRAIDNAATCVAPLGLNDVFKLVRGIRTAEVVELLEGGKILWETEEPPVSDFLQKIGKCQEKLSRFRQAADVLTLRMHRAVLRKHGEEGAEECVARRPHTRPPPAEPAKLEALQAMLSEGLISRTEFDACKGVFFRSIGVATTMP